MPDQPKERPHWIRNTGLVSVALPEPPLAARYAGAQRTDLEEQYDRCHADAALDSLVRAGVNLVWVRFFSGFGVEFERPETDRIREFIGKARARGLKVAAAITLGALLPETLLQEESDCNNWLQVNQDGRHPSSGGPHQYFRSRPCYNSEGYLRFIERISGLAIDAGADLLYFDDLQYNGEPDTCRCPLCVAAFREFLRVQYGQQDDKTRQAGRERFGHNTFTHVRPPVFASKADAELAPVDVPHQQEWIKFKVDTLTKVLARLGKSILKRNPQCGIATDSFKAFGFHTDAIGINYAEQLPLVDLVRMDTVPAVKVELLPEPDKAPSSAVSPGLPPEAFRHVSVPFTNFDDPRVSAEMSASPSASSENSTLRSTYENYTAAESDNIHTMPADSVQDPTVQFISPNKCQFVRALKLARGFDAALVTPIETETDSENAYEIGLAESLAFNPASFGHVGSILSAQVGPGWEGRADGDARIKILRTYLDFHTRYRTTLLLGAKSLANVAVYRDTPSLAFNAAEARRSHREMVHALIARNIPFDIIAQPQLSNLSQYRCLILANSEALSDELVRALEKFVADGGGVVLTEATGTRDSWRRVRVSPAIAGLVGETYPAAVRRETGGGRVAYIPAFTGRFEELDEAVRYAAGGELPLTVRAESGQVLADIVRTRSGATAIHALNVAEESARGVAVTLACPQPPQQIVPLSPTQEFAPVQFVVENGRAMFRVEELKRYALFQVTF